MTIATMYILMSYRWILVRSASSGVSLPVCAANAAPKPRTRTRLMDTIMIVMQIRMPNAVMPTVTIFALSLSTSVTAMAHSSPKIVIARCVSMK